MSYSSTKLAVKDNYEDEEVSDDVDDEVFIRDGRNGFKVDEERGVKRPLMAPRRKIKGSNQFHSEVCKKPPCSTFCAPCFYGFIALCTLLGLIVLITMIINMFPMPLERIRNWTVGPPKKAKIIIPCTEMYTQDVWVKSFPKLVSEAPIKITDLNGDNIDDIIIGYGTGADDIEMSGISCEKYFDHQVPEPCMGGVMALNGLTGDTIWQHWTIRSVLYVDCSTDITNDKINDCLISGKGGVLEIINGKNGEVVWKIEKSDSGTMGINSSGVNVYTAQFIPDVDFDGTPDVLAAHTSNSVKYPEKFEGHLIIFSGKSKSQISMVPTPGEESILDAPQLLVMPDGTNTVVFTTGDVASRGNTYCTHLHSIVKGDISKNHVLLSVNGNSVSPVLVDINNDGTEDIITANGAYVSAFDGITFHQIWNSSVTSADSLNTFVSPTPAYFNDDLVPDIMITQLAGPDILSIYYTQISVLDGRNGQILLERPIIGSGAVDSPAITLNYRGIGNDYFLFWHSVCLDHESEHQPFYIYRENANVREQSRTDFCRVRFNSTTEMRLYALSQHIEPPGTVLYSTDSRWSFEHNETGKVEETQTFIESTSQSIPPILNNYRRKGLSPSTYHRNGNHKSRLQYSSQDVSPSEYSKVQLNYPYFQDRVGSVQEQWPPASLPQEPSYNADNYRERQNIQRLLPPLLGTITDMGQEYDTAYNDDNEESLSGPLAADRDRDERESLQGINESAQNQKDDSRSTNNGNVGRNAQNNSRHTIVKRNASDQIKRMSVPRVAAAATLASNGINNEEIDIVFATHWVPASQHEMVLLTPADLQCIKTRMEQSERVKFQEDELREAMTIECLTERGALINTNLDNALRIDKGQLTVYRLRIYCNCTHVNPELEMCSDPLNFKRQSWPNWGGNSFFKTRQPPF